MGAIAGEAAARYAQGRTVKAGSAARGTMPELLQETMDPTDTARLREIQTALDEGCGVLREQGQVQRTLASLDTIREQLQREGRMRTFVGRAVLVASAIALSASRRVESRGDHFRTDYPNRDDRRWLGNLVAALGQDRSSIALAFEKAGIGARAVVPVR